MSKSIVKDGKVGEFRMHSTTIDGAFDELVERAARMYAIVQPDRSFANDVYKPMLETASDGEVKISYSTYGGSSDITFPVYMTWLMQCMDMLFGASQAEESGDTALAWSRIANALYLLGLLEGTIILEPAIDGIQKERGKAGSSKRNEKYDPLRKLSLELAEQGSDEGPYPSRRQAVLGIKDRIVARSKVIGVNLVANNANKTIDGWLKNMEFGTKRST